MSEKRNVSRSLRTGLKRLLQGAGLLVVALLIIAVIGVVGVTAHFWDLQVGNPSSDTCTSCHVLQTYTDSLTNPHLLASAHANAGLGCTDCHDYGLERQFHETIAYLTNDYEEPFPRARYEMDTCFTCHDHASYSQLAARTADLGVSDGQAKGHDANPHQPPHYSELECHSCHRVHRESVLLCSECHAFRYESQFFGVTPSVPATEEASSGQ